MHRLLDLIPGLKQVCINHCNCWYLSIYIHLSERSEQIFIWADLVHSTVKEGAWQKQSLLWSSVPIPSNILSVNKDNTFTPTLHVDVNNDTWFQTHINVTIHIIYNSTEFWHSTCWTDWQFDESVARVAVHKYPALEKSREAWFVWR